MATFKILFERRRLDTTELVVRAKTSKEAVEAAWKKFEADQVRNWKEKPEYEVEAVNVMTVCE